MPSPGKTYPIHGSGEPMLDADLLRISALLDLGYPLMRNSGPNFEAGIDRTVDPEKHYWVFLFDGEKTLAYSDGVTRNVRQAADLLRNPEPALPEELRVPADLLALYQPGKAPAKALAALDPPAGLLAAHTNVLQTLSTTPRHFKLPWPGRKWVLVRQDQDIEEQVARLDAG